MSEPMKEWKSKGTHRIKAYKITAGLAMRLIYETVHMNELAFMIELEKYPDRLKSYRVDLVLIENLETGAIRQIKTRNFRTKEFTFSED